MENKKYISKRLNVEAIQWNGDNLTEVGDFCIDEFGRNVITVDNRRYLGHGCDAIAIILKSKRCDVCVNRGDYLVKIFNDIIPMSEEEFLENFEEEYENLEFSW